MKLLRLLCLTLIFCNSTAIDIDDIFLSNCTSGRNCDDQINIDFGVSYPVRKINALNEDVDTKNIGQVTTENAMNADATTITQGTIEEKTPTTRISTGGSTSSTIEPSIDLKNEVYSNICPCDLTMIGDQNFLRDRLGGLDLSIPAIHEPGTRLRVPAYQYRVVDMVSTCDIDCCCDADCNASQLSGFPNYSHHQPKMYDSRYCYTKNFIHRNNTEFILARLTSSLFCIAYDNLPPIHGIKASLDIKDRKSFEDVRTAMNPRKYSWEWNKLNISAKINISSQYHHSDGIWKVQNNKMTLIELPQSGFTSECKFGKMLKYQESSKWKCMQTNLSNNNEYLFSKAYDNFTVVSLSHLFNLTVLITQNHTCPDSVCVPVQTFYCLDSRSICNTTKSPEQSCVSGVCQNVIKRVRYKFTLNGTCGIRSIEVRYEITNTSKSFYQYFEVTFEKGHWLLGPSFVPSSSPGYIVGSPIITGTPLRNNVNNVLSEYVNVTNSIFHLTLPMSQSNGDCHSGQRYIVGFGEDIKLKCSVKFTTDQFPSDSCVTLQNRLLDIFFEYLLHNVTEIDKFNTYVSKTGEISENDPSNWTKILFDNVTRNVVTGQTHNNHIRCSGLLTSVNINILYTIQPKLNDFANYKVEGISVTLNEPIDISWLKCVEPKCNNVFKIELLSFVSFTDISTKSMYYYASRPNLDISFPYDFFYPFMNGGSNAKPAYLIIQLVSVFVISNIFKPT